MVCCHPYFHLFFFFNDTATTEIYTLSLHDALPISHPGAHRRGAISRGHPSREHPARHTQGEPTARRQVPGGAGQLHRSEEHTSELQSQSNLVCRLLLEKKKNADDLTAAAILINRLS